MILADFSERPSGKGRFWFLAWPERVLNHEQSTLFRELKTSEKDAERQKMPFMDGHYLDFRAD